MHPYIKHSIDNINVSKTEICVQIFLIFILPILLIKFGIIPIHLRVFLLVILVCFLTAVVFREKWLPSIWGVHKYNYKKYLLAYSIFTICGVFAVSQFGEHIGREELSRWWTYSHFLYVFIIVSAFQEIAYRGYLIPALGKLTSSPVSIVVWNTLIFTFLHVIFPNQLVGLPLAFMGGLGFSIMYLIFPSLPLIIISHSVLNFAVVLYGFFVIPGITY